MSDKIACYTLFDITQTNVLNRARPPDGVETSDWLYKRNTQCNFDTIVQAVSLRSQPENISTPVQVNIIDDYFDIQGPVRCWKFDFEVRSISVFSDGNDELAYLKLDCQDVPMILCGTEYPKLEQYLSAKKPTKNIHFIKY